MATPKSSAVPAAKVYETEGEWAGWTTAQDEDGYYHHEDGRRGYYSANAQFIVLKPQKQQQYYQKQQQQSPRQQQLQGTSLGARNVTASVGAAATTQQTALSTGNSSVSISSQTLQHRQGSSKVALPSNNFLEATALQKEGKYRTSQHAHSINENRILVATGANTNDSSHMTGIEKKRSLVESMIEKNDALDEIVGSASHSMVTNDGTGEEGIVAGDQQSESESDTSASDSDSSDGDRKKKRKRTKRRQESLSSFMRGIVDESDTMQQAARGSSEARGSGESFHSDVTDTIEENEDFERFDELVLLAKVCQDQVLYLNRNLPIVPKLICVYINI